MKLSICWILGNLITSDVWACSSPDYLGVDDLKYAPVIFEGEVIALHPTIKPVDIRHKSEVSRTETVTAMDITFRVNRVLRGTIETRKNGDLDTRIIRVGWIHGTFGYPSTFETFTKRYGRQLRVGLTTPASYEASCKILFRELTTDEGKTYKKDFTTCYPRYTGYYSSDAIDKAYVLNGPCTGAYMFSLNTVTDLDVLEVKVDEIIAEYPEEVRRARKDGLQVGFFWGLLQEQNKNEKTKYDYHITTDMIQKKLGL